MSDTFWIQLFSFLGLLFVAWQNRQQKQAIDVVHSTVNSALETYKREAAAREAKVLAETIKSTRLEEQQIAQMAASELASKLAETRTDLLAVHVAKIAEMSEKMRNLERRIDLMHVSEDAKTSAIASEGKT